ncbi:hypothetical protein LR48_Vigan1444s000100 [Vigna angularis]|uniref:Uncharacterized protein n=1 Tax=Vigna angularis var. angularis TaxID=157739 RepID=A0A0S3TE81_PHAAN|nr:hypothetical protein LR48_Vigan1444s000100 [Vigna angularis]BAU03435.1 hypothetical protein VIGAN_UM105400 [Vigna angularis var. angularis]
MAHGEHPASLQLHAPASTMVHQGLRKATPITAHTRKPSDPAFQLGRTEAHKSSKLGSASSSYKSNSLHVPHLSSIQEEIWTLEAEAEKHAHIAVHSAAWRDSAHLEAQHGSTSHAHSLHGPAKRNDVTGCKSRIVQVAWKEREHAVAHENVPAKAWVHTEKSSLLERGVDDGHSFLQSSKAWEQLGFGQEKILQHVELENAATRPMSKTAARLEGF